VTKILILKISQLSQIIFIILVVVGPKKYHDAYEKWIKLSEGGDNSDWKRKILY
jgi:hypothetical protein